MAVGCHRRHRPSDLAARYAERAWAYHAAGRSDLAALAWAVHLDLEREAIMPNLWTPEAEDLSPANPSGTLQGGGRKCVAHVTVGPAGRPSSWTGAIYALRLNGGEPHYLYDPVTDRLGQFYPLNVSARTVKRGWPPSDPRSCNKAGGRVIHIEFVAMPDGFTRYWRPGPNFRAMMRDIRAQGIPDIWFAGPVSQTPADNRRISWDAYRDGAGWLGHSNVPMNDHWDPGPINRAAIFLAAPIPSAPVVTDPDITTLQRELVELGFLTPADVDGIDGPKTQSAKEAYMSMLDDLRKEISDQIDRARRDILAALTVPLNEEGGRVFGTGRVTITVGQAVGGLGLAARRSEVVLALAHPDETEAMRKWASDGGPKPGLRKDGE